MAAVQTANKYGEVTQEQELGLEPQLGKRRLTHDPNLLTTSKKLDAYVTSIGGQNEHNFYVKGGGTHELIPCKFKCGRCGQNGHVRQDCTLEEELCHRCHQLGHIKVN